jgi:hypothetical protein
MNPLDDHELLIWSMQAGLARAEVRQTVRCGLDAGDLFRRGASETADWRRDRFYVDMEAVPVVARVGHSPLELREWPAALIERFQACDIMER